MKEAKLETTAKFRLSAGGTCLSTRQDLKGESSFVDVWFGELSIAADRNGEFWACLSEAERERARRFKLDAARQRFVTSRGLLRQTLAGYLDCAPGVLQFVIGEHGKPELVDRRLAFNLSHSGDWLLLAVSNLPVVGVDVEVIKPRKTLEQLAERCFSARELDYWQQLPPEQRRQQFFQLWTSKEAFVKAVGRGIALGLECCEVDVETWRGFRILPNDYGPAEDWRIQCLPLNAGVAASLVTGNVNHLLRCMPFCN